MKPIGIDAKGRVRFKQSKQNPIIDHGIVILKATRTIKVGEPIYKEDITT